MDAQPEERSVEDRIADYFGPEEEPEQQAEPEVEEVEEVEATEETEGEEPEQKAEEDEGPGFVEMEIDGQLYEIPEQLKDHILRQQDYTQKTQELSAQRKEAEAIRAAVQQEQAKYQFLESVQDEMQQAEMLKAQIDQVQQYRREQIDSLDYKDLIKLDSHRDELQAQLNALGQSLQTKQQEFQQAQQQSITELLDKSTEALKSKIPNWGEETQKQVRDFAIQKGFSEEELNSVYDPRYVEVLWEASQYRKLKEGAGAAVKKVQDAPAIKPKARKPMPKEVGDKLNLRKKMKAKNATNDAKANALGNYIADKFM